MLSTRMRNGESGCVEGVVRGRRRGQVEVNEKARRLAAGSYRSSEDGSLAGGKAASPELA